MNRKLRLGLIGWSYALALLPLVLGSATFFCWFHARRWYAHDLDIEGFALFCILLYFASSVAVLVMSIIGLVRDRLHWYETIGPLLIAASTWLFVDLYDAQYSAYRDKVFVGIDVRGSKITDVRLWSPHFEQGFRRNPSEKKLVFAFDPVYTYDWGYKSSISFHHSVDPVFVEVIDGTMMITYALPPLEKGSCLRLNESQLKSLPRARNREEVYGKPKEPYPD